MAKTRRSRRRYFRSKGRWSSNISKVNNTQITAGVGNWSTFTDLCTNPIQANTTVSQQYTVKNIEFTFQMEIPGGALAAVVESITIYIMYVPQGMTVNNDYHIQHPEYIMAYRFIGSPEYEATGSIANGIRNPLRIKTRLARRLQTGDKIIAYFEGFNGNNTSVNIDLNGVIRWWTKAN